MTKNTTVTESDVSDPSAHEAPLTRRNSLVIILLLTSAFVVILNETIMRNAVPVIVAELGITPRPVGG